MDRSRSVSRGGDDLNKIADSLISSAVIGPDENKLLLLRLFSAVKNRGNFLREVDDPLIDTVGNYLWRAYKGQHLDVSSLCGIAFNKLRATLPVYMTENIPPDSICSSGSAADKKLNQFATNIKMAREDGKAAALLFMNRDHDIKLRLLGFALCAAYRNTPTTPAREFEAVKAGAAKLRGDVKMYVKGSPLGIQYKDGFIEQLIKSFAGKNQKDFFDISMDISLKYEEKKEKILALIEKLLSERDDVVMEKNSAKGTDDDGFTSSTTSTTTATITSTTATTTTTASLPTMTSTATIAADGNDDVAFDSLIDATPAYPGDGKDRTLGS